MRVLSPVVALVILLSGCSAEGSPQFSPDDLPDLVLPPSEVPPPLVLDPGRSGYITLGLSEGEAPSDEPVLIQQGTNVYVYRAFYTQPDMLKVERIPGGTSQFMLHAAWYESVGVAAAGLRQTLGRDRPPGFRGQRFRVEGLGPGAGRYETPPDEEFSYRGDFLGWRRENVVITMLAVALPLKQLLDMAERLDQRLASQG